MEIPVEVLVVLIIALVLFLWATWFRLSRWRARRKYTIEKDKANVKKNEKENSNDKTGRTTGRRKRFGIRKQDSSRPSQLTERELLATTSSTIPSKDSKSPRGFFARRRR